MSLLRFRNALSSFRGWMANQGARSSGSTQAPVERLHLKSKTLLIFA